MMTQFFYNSPFGGLNAEVRRSRSGRERILIKGNDSNFLYQKFINNKNKILFLIEAFNQHTTKTPSTGLRFLNCLFSNTLKCMALLVRRDICVYKSPQSKRPIRKAQLGPFTLELEGLWPAMAAQSEPLLRSLQLTVYFSMLPEPADASHFNGNHIQ